MFTFLAKYVSRFSNYFDPPEALEEQVDSSNFVKDDVILAPKKCSCGGH